jgi:magnesium transporter
MHKMSQTMTLLTAFATIFMPPTLIASLYGMNFDYMPELHWKGSYFVLLGAMVVMTVGMVLYFKKRGWM